MITLKVSDCLFPAFYHALTAEWVHDLVPHFRRCVELHFEHFESCGIVIIWVAHLLVLVTASECRPRLATFTLYVGAIELLLILIEEVARKTGAVSTADSISDWTSLLGFFLCILAIILAIRWFRSHVLWSVRNRLLVTYLFVGAVPVTLALALAVGSGYLVVEHLATFLAVSEIQASGATAQFC